MFNRHVSSMVAVVFGVLAGSSFAADVAGDLALTKALAQVNLFSELTDAEKETLKPAATLRHGRAGELIIEHNKSLDRMFVVLDGQVEVRINGKIIATSSGQSLVGEMEFLDKLPAAADVQLLKETDLVELNNAALAGIMEKQPRLGHVLMRSLARIESQRLRYNNANSERMLAEQNHPVIDKVRLDFNAAYNEGNVQALAKLVDADAIWLPTGEPVIVGVDKIKTCYSDYFSKARSVIELKPGAIQVTGDSANICGDFTRTDTLKAESKAKRFSGNYLFVLKKQADGSWKISRDIWNEKHGE